MKKYMRLLLAAALAITLLAGCGGAGTADNPKALANGSDFAKWFQEGKGTAISGKDKAGQYYFQLTADVKVSNVGLINNAHDVVLDLNGHTLTGDGSQVFSVAGGGKLTLKNGTVQATGVSANGGVVAVDGGGCALHLEDVTMSVADDKGGATSDGGVLYAFSPADQPAIITVKGNSVINGSAAGTRRFGGAVALVGGSQMYLLGGTVQNGKAGCGGNFYLSETARLYIAGGTVAGGEAVDNSQVAGEGGNIALCAQAQVHQFSGMVTGGTATKNGGNLFVFCYGESGTSGYYQYGGAVETGAADCGGNIYAMETPSLVRLDGGEVRQGKARQGGNLYLQDAVLEMRGAVLTGLQEDDTAMNGGNIYSKAGKIYLYDGQITKGWSKDSGANIYGIDTTLMMYGGSITYGSSDASGTTAGGGNVFLNGASVFDIYAGEIANGECNRSGTANNSSAGNVMIMDTTRMQMFGGVIRDGILKGNPCRCGNIMISGMNKGDNTYFHMYGGTLENEALPASTSRGHILGAYSNTASTDGQGVARIFDGDINYKGDKNGGAAQFTLWARRGYEENPWNVYVFQTKYKGLYQHANTSCEDGSHNNKVEDVAATCTTPGCTKYHCNSCGDWYKVTAPAAGHTETATAVAATALLPGYTEHSCSACSAKWITAE